MPLLRKPSLKRAREELKTLAEKVQATGEEQDFYKTDRKTSFICLNKDGTPEESFRDSCHGSLLNGRSPIVFKPHWFITTRVYSIPPTPAVKAFIKWMVEESPWKECIKSSAEEIEERGIIFDASKFSAKWIIAACILFRMTREYVVVIEAWWLFKKHTDPYTALFLAHMACAKTGNSFSMIDFEDTFSLEDRWGVEHSLFQKSSSFPSSLKRFKRHRPTIDIHSPTMEEVTDFRGVSKIFYKDTMKKEFIFPEGKIEGHRNHFGDYVNTITYKKTNLKKVVKSFLELNK